MDQVSALQQKKSPQSDQDLTQETEQTGDISIAPKISVEEINKEQEAQTDIRQNKELELRLATEYENATEFVGAATSLAVNISLMDSLAKNLNDEQQKQWQVTRRRALNLSNTMQNEVVEQIRLDLSGFRNEGNPSEEIKESTMTLQDITNDLEPLLSITEKIQASNKAEKKEDKVRNFIRKFKLPTLTIAGPVEEAFQSTGIIDEIVQPISEILRGSVLPLFDKLEENLKDGELNFDKLRGVFKRDLNDWRTKLRAKQDTFPYTVLPELLFKHLMEHGSRSAAVQELIGEIDSSGNLLDKNQWSIDKKKWEKDLEEIGDLLEGGYQDIAETFREVHKPENRTHRKSIKINDKKLQTAATKLDILQSKILTKYDLIQMRKAVKQ